MTMPADFVALIEAHSDVVGLLGDRIFPLVIPRQVWDGNDRRPCISYQSSTQKPGQTFCATDDLRSETFTLACHAFTYDEARSLARAVSAAVLDYSGVSGASDIDVVTLDSEFDGVEPEPGIYQRILQFSVWYRST